MLNSNDTGANKENPDFFLVFQTDRTWLCPSYNSSIFITNTTFIFIRDKVLKNRPSKICGRQSLKTFTWSILEYFAPFVKNSRSLRFLILIREFHNKAGSQTSYEMKHLIRTYTMLTGNFYSSVGILFTIFHYLHYLVYLIEQNG